MDTNELRKKLNIKQSELNSTQDIEKRKFIDNDIKILRYKLELERIKQLIKQLQNSQ